MSSDEGEKLSDKTSEILETEASESHSLHPSSDNSSELSSGDESTLDYIDHSSDSEEEENNSASVKRSKIDENAFSVPETTKTPPPAPVSKPIFGSAAKSIVSFTSLAGVSKMPIKNLFAQDTATNEKEEKSDSESSPNVDKPYEVITGEENEDTLFTVKGKLFEFHSTSKDWVERGVGTLKLNMDSKNKKYRLLMRTDTVQKLVLNSGIFSGMSFEIVQPKNLRFSAHSLEGKIQTYLLRTKSAEEAESLKQQVQRVLETFEDDKVVKDC